jgi:hypothetical protein
VVAVGAAMAEDLTTVVAGRVVVEGPTTVADGAGVAEDRTTVADGTGVAEDPTTVVVMAAVEDHTAVATTAVVGTMAAAMAVAGKQQVSGGWALGLAIPNARFANVAEHPEPMTVRSVLEQTSRQA